MLGWGQGHSVAHERLCTPGHAVLIGADGPPHTVLNACAVLRADLVASSVCLLLITN